MTYKGHPGYEGTVFKCLEEIGRTDIDPRHVVAWMRLQYGTLDHLDLDTFRRETRIGVGCTDKVGTEEAEDLALTYGL